MTDEDAAEATLAPDEAFAVLGDETRIGILRALGAAEEPLSFSELRERVGVDDSGQFNYHLEKVVGHFVAKSDEGYTLRRSGRRVVEAVLSGAVTETPAFERTRIEEACEYCGAPVEVRWRSGNVELFCTECAGRYGQSYGATKRPEPVAAGYLGRMPLPPAGLQGRTPDEIVRAAWTWSHLEMLAMSSGLCPRCSAPVETDVFVCEDHDASDGLCDRCDGAHAVNVGARCTNCIFRSGGVLVVVLLADTALLAFLTAHGLNPVAPDSIRRLNEVLADYDETVLSTDPFRARFTFGVDGDRLTLTVDDDLSVVGVDHGTAASQ
ncbi:helix-turn-helix domain-containing protein [Halomicroarcula sp. F13]|uniref:Helix-turn-helix domain-containing protein n=1 Tax=Haloarcula rubra TaxID=2487747 RepID=A0AAW4PSP3_9EURY|nr:helix-turn-helix domain-containing protein [Halomicroarcula rubra]MBX0324154.1 helix-turn-helix domain-containing protein [Halomicroarcula rubra]